LIFAICSLILPLDYIAAVCFNRYRPFNELSRCGALKNAPEHKPGQPVSAAAVFQGNRAEKAVPETARPSCALFLALKQLKV